MLIIASTLTRIVGNICCISGMNSSGNSLVSLKGCSPRLYTKIIKVAISHIREQNILISASIDDPYCSWSFLQCRESTFATTERCELREISSSSFLTIWTLRIDYGSDDLGGGGQSREENLSIRKVASLTCTMVSYTPGVDNGLLHYRVLKSC